MSEDHRSQEPRGLDQPRDHATIVRALAMVCTLLFAFDLLDLAGILYHKHPHFEFEKLPGFYALYGFSGSVVLVLAAKGLRRLLERKEGYYDD